MGKNNIKRYILVLIAAFIIGGIVIPKISDIFTQRGKHSLEDVLTVDTRGDIADAVIVQEKVPYTVSVNFEDVFLSETQRQQKLQIMTQKVSASYTTTKSGLFNWGIFSQTKAMVFHGVGTYTVDLAAIGTEAFVVDDENQKITIHIPAPELSVEILPEKTEFFDTSNGLLRFGEMQLTPEAMAEIEVLGKEKLTAELVRDNESAESARRFAKLSVQEIFQPIVTAQITASVKAANDKYAVPVYYTVEVEIDD